MNIYMINSKKSQRIWSKRRHVPLALFTFTGLVDNIWCSTELQLIYLGKYTVFIKLSLTSFYEALILSKCLLRKSSDALLEALFAATSIIFFSLHMCAGGIRGFYPLLPTFLPTFVMYQCKMMWLHHEGAHQEFEALFSWDSFVNEEYKICF